MRYLGTGPQHLIAKITRDRKQNNFSFGAKLIVVSVSFCTRLSLPTDKSQKSSIRGEADLELGSFCNATRNGENDSIKV